MNSLRKINYIFDKKQKIILVILFFVILLGAFLELLGVSAIFPLVNVVIDSSILQTDEKYKFVYQLFQMRSEKQFIVFAAIGLILLYLVKNIYVIFMYNLQFRFTFGNQGKLASRMMKYYINQDYVFHLSKNSAELQRNIIQDISMFSSTVLSIIELFTEICVAGMLAIFLLITDITTTISVSLLIFLFAGIFYVIYKKVMVAWGSKYRRLNAQVIKWIQQSLGGIKEVKILNREDYFLGAFNRNYDNTMKYTRKQKMLGTISRPIMETICIGGLLTTIAVKVGAGGDLTTFIPTLSVFAVAAFRMLPSFNRITSYMSIITFNKSAIDAVYKELKQADEFAVKKSSIAERGNIEFQSSIEIKNLKYRYPNTEKDVIDNISFTIPRNKSVAFVGPSGSGKTTLVDLIIGVLKPNEGEILSDGVEVHTNLSQWFKHIGYIPQNIYLIDDTIRNNIAFGIKANQIEDEKVWHALEQAQLDDFVRALEKGLDTEIGEKGVRLSGGQKQRIGIARTLYSNPSILVLDEATSALDNETEKAVMESIKHLQGMKTILIIAHRLTTVVNCDRIYEVKNGNIQEISYDKVLLEIENNTNRN